MRFRLTYDGKLMARGGGADHKHEIRRVFHQQLKRQWELNPYLVHWAKSGTEGNEFGNKDPQFKNMSHVDYLAHSFRKGNFRFVPLATEQWNVIVSLDILFLRTGKPGAILRSADLDGRLKTLIDALRIPGQIQELGKYEHPDTGEDPFYCLMEDDSLVGNVSITTDTLLQPTPKSHGFHDTHDARIVVAVSIRGYAGFSWARHLSEPNRPLAAAHVPDASDSNFYIHDRAIS